MIEKIFEEYCCDICDFICNKKSAFERHFSTIKHLNKIKKQQKYQKQQDCKEEQKSFSNYETKRSCKYCNKEYKVRNSLWYHEKKCKINNIIKTNSTNNININNTNAITINNNNNIDIVEELIKQNQEFKNLLIEQNNKLLELASQEKHTTNNFNLNIFLNEQCKDALNIMDFVNSLKLQLTDLDAMGKLGYSEGISKIFIRGLKELDIFKRPIHCSDLKRDILYIKDKNAWEKENDDNKKMKLAINCIAHKNVNQIPSWITENPEATDYDSKKHLEYIKILGESMGPISQNEEENNKNYNKIIKNVAKSVVIEKV